MYASIKLNISKCKAGNKYFDSYRNMFVCITPEENVRQKTCKIMSDYFGIPVDMMHVEEHLSHYGVREKNGRADILITYLDNKGNEKPLVVIECKEERIAIIAQQVLEQAAGYATYLKTHYFIVTNGMEMICYRYNKDDNSFEAIDGLLSYEDMLNKNYSIGEKISEFKRLSYNKYYNVKQLKKYEWIGQKIGTDTEVELVPTIINIDDCLLDISHKLRHIPSSRYVVIEDLGEQYRNYNDASGGRFGSGYYRMIRLMDNTINEEFLIGFTIVTTGKMINDKKYGTSDGKSVLIIMKNDGDRDEMSVQINLNKCIKINGKCSKIIHNALITRKGKTKKELLEYVKNRNEKLVQNSNIILGTLDCSRPLFIDNDDVQKFIANAVEYAVYRDEYKNSM